MPRINLLPWRDEERKERKLKFLVCARWRSDRRLPHGVRRLPADGLDGQRAGGAQRRRSRSEIAELDKQIEKINSLEADKARFIARMEVIEKLQRSRPEIVHIFDEIAKQLPDGVYLTGITQTGTRLKFEGVAQSSTRVSAFMRNIDGSSYLKNPELDSRRDQEETTCRRDVRSVRRPGRRGAEAEAEPRTNPSGASRRRGAEQ